MRPTKCGKYSLVARQELTARRYAIYFADLDYEFGPRYAFSLAPKYG
jgi:hypothetical protein